MAATTIITRPTPLTLDSIELDAVVSEQHSLTSTITDHPVEEGASVSDHSRPEPPRVQLDCIVSNTPLANRRSSTVRDSASGRSFVVTAEQEPSRGKNAYDRLLQLQEAGSLITVVTSLRTYESMVIESISIPRDAKTSNALRFTVQLKRVRVVKNKLTRVVVAKDPRAGGKVKTGSQTTKPAQAEDVDPLRQVVNGVKGAANKVGGLF